MAIQKKKPIPTIKEADLIEYKNLKDRIGRLQEKQEAIKKTILAIHDATKKEMIRVGMTCAIIETTERRYPQWKSEVEKLEGIAYVEQVIKNTLPMKVKQIKIAKAS